MNKLLLILLSLTILSCGKSKKDYVYHDYNYDCVDYVQAEKFDSVNVGGAIIVISSEITCPHKGIKIDTFKIPNAKNEHEYGINRFSQNEMTIQYSLNDNNYTVYLTPSYLLYGDQETPEKAKEWNIGRGYLTEIKEVTFDPNDLSLHIKLNVVSSEIDSVVTFSVKLDANGIATVEKSERVPQQLPPN